MLRFLKAVLILTIASLSLVAGAYLFLILEAHIYVWTH